MLHERRWRQCTGVRRIKGVPAARQGPGLGKQRERRGDCAAGSDDERGGVKLRGLQREGARRSDPPAQPTAAVLPHHLVKTKPLPPILHVQVKLGAWRRSVLGNLPFCLHQRLDSARQPREPGRRRSVLREDHLSLGRQLVSVGNSAGGGGGAVFWDEIQPTLLSDLEGEDASLICASTLQSNRAIYGPCVATSFHRLLLELQDKEVFSPGVSFVLRVAKLDFYSQRILTDSSTSLQIRTVKLSAQSGSAMLLGSSVMTLEKGAATGSFMVKMYFAKSNDQEFPAQVGGAIGLEAYGIDSASSKEMLSNAVEAQPSRTVCPVGYVMKTDQSRFPSLAVCDRCSPDSYALSPQATPATRRACAALMALSAEEGN
eukprot:753484-Hanusia_phi.AAC.1